MVYLKRIMTRRPPQSAPLPGSNQVPDSAGGFTWPVDDWTRLHRFLVLGSEGGRRQGVRFLRLDSRMAYRILHGRSAAALPASQR